MYNPTVARLTYRALLGRRRAMILFLPSTGAPSAGSSSRPSRSQTAPAGPSPAGATAPAPPP